MQLRVCYENLHLKFYDNLSYTYKYMALYAHIYKTCVGIYFKISLVSSNDYYINGFNSKNELCVSLNWCKFKFILKGIHFVVACL